MFRQIALASSLIALAAGITACGSSGSGGGSSPLASDTVATIIQQATANTLQSQSFTISGGTTGSATIHMTIVRTVGCAGTITQGAAVQKLVWVGKTVYGQKTGMPANQWQRGTSTDADLQSLISVCEPSTYLDPLLTTSGGTNASRSVTVVGGQPALTLSLPASNQSTGKPATIVVTNTPAPLLLSITEPGSGNFTFTGYGAAKTITPPSAS
jgi:hypothetical protein